MTCDLVANGPCTVTATGACSAPKEIGELTSFTITRAIGLTDTIEIDWDAGTPPPVPVADDFIEILYVEEGTMDYEPLETVDRTDLTVTLSVSEDTYYSIWLRAASFTEVGDWTRVKVNTATEIGNWVLDPDGNTLLDPDGNPIPEF